MTTTISMYERLKQKWHEADAESPLFTALTEQAFDLALRAIHYANIAGFNGEYVCYGPYRFVRLIKDSNRYSNQCKWLEKHYAKRVKDAKAAA